MYFLKLNSHSCFYLLQRYPSTGSFDEQVLRSLVKPTQRTVGKKSQNNKSN